MKAKTLQILWHGKDPVLSLDFHPSGLLATGGADKDIRLWQLERDSDGAPVASFQTSLSHHNLPVNIVRFSPTGDHLASGGDGGELMLWKLVVTATGSSIWKVVAVLKNHSKDVADLCWSLDGASLVTASVDNSCIIWDVAKGSARQFLEGHQHFVQGVAWDPLGHFIVSQSADRSCRVYAPQPQGKGKQSRRGEGFVLQHTLAKRETAPGAAVAVEPAGEGEAGPSKPGPTKHHMFQDENMPSFFRRLAWSPDGSFLVTPAGLYKHTAESRAVNTSYVFSRKDWSSPVMHLPGAGKSVVAVRFCPRLFKRLQNFPAVDGAPDLSTTLKLPYRLIYVVATLDSIFLYDTQRSTPIALLAGLHYAAISDVAWSADAQYLSIASQDGYCTVVAFDEGELGEVVPLEELPAHVAEHLPEACRSRAADSAAKEREEAAAGPRTGSEERTPSPEQQPRVATAAGHVESSAKRPAEERPEGADAPPQKQARRITPVASAPAENVLDAAAADGPALGVKTLERDSRAGEKAPRRITPVASAPVVESALLGGVTLAEGAFGSNGHTMTAKSSAKPAANVPPPKRVVPLSVVELAGPNPAASLNPVVSPQAVPLPPKRIAPVAVPPLDVAGGQEAKKRRITPVTVPAGEESKSPLDAVKQTPTVTKPRIPEPASQTTEVPKPVRRITPSPSPPVEDASLTTPVKGRSADVSNGSLDVRERQASPAAKASPVASGASPDASGVRSAKPIRRISPSPCKPVAGLEELARSASVEIARALSVEPTDSNEK
ncbi:Putative chromatin assembly complex 1 subunit B/CAC2 [Klebsormidium nitens]|uniref:Putative chromatin assembly complex 1 subunit B/CAC2 n=1 Tax=Klebsormidium nitens TaxID=105231 RepID=A0A1Y1HW32_KLENI|nr:Putative chromatin assembly complex 1 subunit B/CAC2 [Klebsormidium nitens]|eukprot:GAQ82373.1 Putative chromatin assembly complex 1 subunit B/CAC2 [Klebsormidium nitens]